MNRPTKAQQKAVVEQWRRAAPALEAARRNELANWQYDWTTVDALLEVGDRVGRTRSTSGLAEMQRFFMKAARRRSPIPRGAMRSTPHASENSRVNQYSSRDPRFRGSVPR